MASRETLIMPAAVRKREARIGLEEIIEIETFKLRARLGPIQPWEREIVLAARFEFCFRSWARKKHKGYPARLMTNDPLKLFAIERGCCSNPELELLDLEEIRGGHVSVPRAREIAVAEMASLVVGGW